MTSTISHHPYEGDTPEPCQGCGKHPDHPTHEIIEPTPARDTAEVYDEWTRTVSTDHLFRVTLRTEAGVKVAEGIALAAGSLRAAGMVSRALPKRSGFTVYYDPTRTEVYDLGAIAYEDGVEHDGVLMVRLT